jgi:hypothetical protein
MELELFSFSCLADRQEHLNRYCQSNPSQNLDVAALCLIQNRIDMSIKRKEGRKEKKKKSLQ